MTMVILHHKDDSALVVWNLAGELSDATIQADLESAGYRLTRVRSVEVLKPKGQDQGSCSVSRYEVEPAATGYTFVDDPNYEPRVQRNESQFVGYTMREHGLQIEQFTGNHGAWKDLANQYLRQLAARGVLDVTQVAVTHGTSAVTGRQIDMYNVKSSKRTARLVPQEDS